MESPHLESGVAKLNYLTFSKVIKSNASSPLAVAAAAAAHRKTLLFGMRYHHHSVYHHTA